MIGAVAAGQLGRRYAAAEMNRLRARLEERIGFWQGETERARANAAQVAERPPHGLMAASRAARMSCPWRVP